MKFAYKIAKSESRRNKVNELSSIVATLNVKITIHVKNLTPRVDF